MKLSIMVVSIVLPYEIINAIIQKVALVFFLENHFHYIYQGFRIRERITAMWGKKYVIRCEIMPNLPYQGTVSYHHKHGHISTANHAIEKAQIQLAKRHAFNTRAGAERFILTVKRALVCSLDDFNNFSQNHTMKETHDWMDEKVKKHNWKNSEHKFTVITFDEMLQEIKKQRILIDD